VMKALKDENHPNVVYGVGNVQEEVGLRGAKTATNKIQPDIGFAVDVGVAGDTPGITANESTSKVGAGPQIIIYDASMVGHKGLRDLVVVDAEKLNITYQFDSTPGRGTDAASMHIAGTRVPSIAIINATRYIHSHAGILHRNDYENTVKL